MLPFRRIYERIQHVEGKLDEALTPEGWEPLRVGDRVEYDGFSGKVSNAPEGDYAATDEVTFQAHGKTRGTPIEAGTLPRLDAGEPTSADEALLDAFREAISTALA